MMMALLPYALLVGVLLILWLTNFRRRRRNEQWLFPVAALVFSVAALAAVYWLREEYLSLLARYDLWVQWIEAIVPIVVPKDVFGLLPWLNGAFLLLFSLIKLLLRGSLALVARLRKTTPRGDSAWGAYAHVKDQGWQRQPEWYFALQACRALTVLAFFLLLVCWQVYEGRWSPPLTPILPAMALVIFAECAAYLGGQSPGLGAVELRGDDVSVSAFGNYSKVWKEMLAIWPKHWLATGSVPIWRRPNGPQ